MKKNLLLVIFLCLVAFQGCKKQDSNPVEPATHGTIKGTIISSETLTGMSGVNVYSTPATGFVTTGTDGSYEIRTVLPGDYQITAAKNGFDTLTVGISITAGATTTADFILEKYDTLKTITNGSIEGLIYNSVTLESVSQVNITTVPTTGSYISDSNGKFSILDITPGVYQINASKVGFNDVTISVSVGKRQLTAANIFIVPIDTTTILTNGWIEGVIYDADSNKTISGAIITTSPATSSIISDSNGKYTLNDLAPGDYTVNVSKLGFVDASTPITVTAGTKTIADFVLIVASGSITGTVIDDSTGLALKGVNIQTNPSTISTITNNSGNFQINNVVPGTYEVTAILAGYDTKTFEVDVKAGENTQADVVLKSL